MSQRHFAAELWEIYDKPEKIAANRQQFLQRGVNPDVLLSVVAEDGGTLQRSTRGKLMISEAASWPWLPMLTTRAEFDRYWSLQCRVSVQWPDEAIRAALQKELTFVHDPTVAERAWLFFEAMMAARRGIHWTASPLGGSDRQNEIGG